MISDQYRCIFIHIPKCAGTAIENVIWPGPRTVEDLWLGFVDAMHNRYQTGGLQHLLAKQVQRHVGTDTFGSFFKFAAVRNPYDRIVSQYAFMSRRPDLRAFIGMEEGAPFAHYLDLISRKTHVQWMPQHDFILDDRGNSLVDRIVRHETIDKDFAEILAVLGIPPQPLPKVNVGIRGPYRDYYDRETRALVKEMFSKDLDLLGYEF